MDFKFYIYNKDGLHNYLCCKDENNRIFLYKKYKYQKNEWLYIDNKTEWQEKYMAEITEQAAEDFCFNYVYRTPVKIRKKTYASLHDLPDPRNKKIILFGIIVAAILFTIIFLITKSKNFLYFSAFAIVFAILSIIAEKITGFEGEGEIIVIFVGIIIYVLSRVL